MSKALITSVSIIALFVLLFAQPASGEEVIKVAGNKYSPPYHYLNEYGMYKGFSVDILNALTIESGLNIDFYPMADELSRHTLERGLIQGIVGIPYTKENEAKFLLTKPFITLTESIIVDVDTQQIIHPSDLRQHKVAISQHSAAYELLKSDSRIQFVFTESPQESLELLMSKDVNAVIVNKTIAYFIAQQMGKENNIKVIGEPVSEVEYGIALAKDRHDLLKKINAGITELIKNGTYDKIHKKWFGEAFTDPNVKILKEILTGAAIGLGIISLISLLILRWNYLLKKEVAHRTAELQEVNQALQRKRQEVQEQVYFKDLILNNVDDAIIMLNGAGIIQSANTKSLEYFHNHTLSSLLQTKLKETVIGQLIESALHESENVAETGRRHIEIEYTTPQNKKLSLEVVLFPFINRDLLRDGTILVIRDVTIEKQLRENLYRQGKLQALGQLVAGVAHELRNPLMAIETFIQVLPDKYDSPAFRERFITHISKEVERLNRVTADLLDFGKPKVPTKEMFSVSQLLEETLTVFKAQMEQRQITLKQHIVHDLIYADRLLIKQVLINLLLNAMDAIGRQGVIEISSESLDNQYVLAVKDSGEGIAANELEHIFDPFFTKKPTGVGLGLSISHQFIADQHGTISVSSKVGEGTTFTITLPHRKHREDK